MKKLILLVIPAALCATASRAEVPLTWDATGHIMVPARIDGKGPYPFMLDTGADETGVYAWFALAHALPKGHMSKLSGAVGTQTETTTMIDTLSVDSRTIRQIQADTITNRADGVKIAGIMGVDLMGGYLTVLDTGCGTAALLPLDTDPAKAAGSHPVFLDAGGVKDGKQLTFPVTINGVAGVAILDTGARSTMVNIRFAKAAGADITSPAFTRGAAVRGATTQSVTSRTGPIGTIRFAGITRSDVTARVVDLPVFADMGLSDRPTVNIGMDMLRDLRLTVDYRHHRIAFAPSACPAR